MKRWYMNEERELLQAAFREFAQTRIRPYVAKMEEEDAGARDLVLEMGQLGFLGLCIPEEYGGAGKDYISLALLLEEIGKESQAVGVSTMIAGMFNRYLLWSASEEQIQKYVVPAVNGEIIIAMSANEASGGSWIDGYETFAEKDGEDWIINGTKVLITQVDGADVYIASAINKEVAKEKAAKKESLTFADVDYFLIEADTEGVQVGHIENKVGWNGSRTGTVYFNDVRVPASAHIEGGVIMTPEEFSALYGAMALGGAEAVIEKTVSYMKQRVQDNGLSIWETHQAARNDIARLEVKVNNFRNAVYGHMANKNGTDSNFDFVSEALSIKYEAPRLLEEVARECMTLMGGAGLIYETGVERFYRDAMVTEIACGSNKTYLSTIASMM